MINSVSDLQETRQGMSKFIGFPPTKQNTLYLLHRFDSDIEIITMSGKPAICILKISN